MQPGWAVFNCASQGAPQQHPRGTAHRPGTQHAPCAALPSVWAPSHYPPSPCRWRSSITLTRCRAARRRRRRPTRSSRKSATVRPNVSCFMSTRWERVFCVPVQACSGSLGMLAVHSRPRSWDVPMGSPGSLGSPSVGVAPVFLGGTRTPLVLRPRHGSSLPRPPAGHTATVRHSICVGVSVCCSLRGVD